MSLGLCQLRVRDNVSHDAFSNRALAVAAFPTHCPSARSRGGVEACHREHPVRTEICDWDLVLTEVTLLL